MLTLRVKYMNETLSRNTLNFKNKATKTCCLMVSAESNILQTKTTNSKKQTKNISKKQKLKKKINKIKKIINQTETNGRLQINY